MGTGTSGLANKLVEGAFDATAGPSEWVSPENQAKYAEANEKMIDAGGKMVTALIAKEQKKKEAEEAEKAKQLEDWDKLANMAIEDSQYMTEDEYKALADELKADRELFINADSEEKAILLSNLENKRDEIEKVKKFRTTLSTSATDPDGVIGNESWLLSSEGMEYKDILSGTKSMTSQDGKYGYMMYDSSIQEDRKTELDNINIEIDTLSVGEDGDLILDLNKRREELEDEINTADIDPRGDQVFRTVYDMEKTIKHQSFDREINNVAMEFATNAQTLGANVPQGSQSNFDYESTHRLVTNEILGKGNIRSLMEDKHIGGQSWEQYMTEALSTATYEDLGVDLTSLGMNAETLETLDPTKGDNKITDDDVRGIIQSLKSNKNMTKEYIANYFTNFIKQNYQSGYNSRPKPNPIEVEFDENNPAL